LPAPRFAALSDIHGNRWALEAILEDLARRRIRRVVNLGDCVYGPLDPGGTAEMLLRLDWPTVRGNEDRLLDESGTDTQTSPSLQFTRERLLPHHLAWLRELPLTLSTSEGFFLCHGTPTCDDDYLLFEATPTGLHRRPVRDLSAMLVDVPSTGLLCGHDHTPASVELDDGRVIVNPGSVGLPAYEAEEPHHHVIENRTTHARYAILEPADRGWLVEQRAVPYDWQAAAAAARAHGRPDWAFWLSGRATA